MTYYTFSGIGLTFLALTATLYTLAAVDIWRGKRAHF